MSTNIDNTKHDDDSVAPPALVTGVTTCIVGGGNSAHVLVSLLSEAGHRVHLLTRRPDDWQDEVVCHVFADHAEEVVHKGRLHTVSSNPADVVPQADIVVLCLPVHQYRPALNRIAPFINRTKETVFVGAMYGQAGFNWMVDTDVVREYRHGNVAPFAIGSIPWICRITGYGRSVNNYGAKHLNLVAVKPRYKFEKLNRMFLQPISEIPFKQGKFEQASFLR
jgi:opine dehydrogenase